ncbi:Ger(x)C family spore germination protein [Ureibacillus manganicus]|uniref:Uncharacterized protein n=1 Tax=Ureibacillus manganicus DSM 26584 TaxID=1384049 RepID=A0A0A3I6A7_9BACL|nr:Ger(x)C family spore germination protein [Ureibacillus manganicus]KGR80291.1 hypothetical protein CD29_02765 [Ureibacillus manganicus DSM 26584]
MKCLKKVFFMVILLLLLTGCWDKVELEDRAFVYGIAIDTAEKQSEIKLTSQLIVPSQLSTLGGGGGSGPAFRNLSVTGETIIDTNREMIKQTSRVPDPTHIKVILFSEDIVKQPTLFKEYIDLFLREKDMRRGILIAVASGEAGELLSVEPQHEKIPTQYIGRLLETKGNLETIESIRVGDIQEKLLERESFPLPVIEKLDSKSVNYVGIAIYNGKKDQMVGLLKGDEAKGLSVLIEEKNTGTLNINVEGKSSTVELLKINHKITLVNNNPNNFEFKISLKIIGTIAEQFGNQDVMNAEVHDKFQLGLEQKIHEITTKAVEKLQKDYKTDVLELGPYLHHYHPKVWEQTKDNWEFGENNFSKSKINFDIHVMIERPGTINKTSDRNENRQ